MAKTYRSRIDSWLALCLLIAGLMAVAGAIMVLLTATGDDWAAAFAMAIAIILIGAGLPIWVMSSTDYVIEGEILRIRSGPFRWRVPISEISRMTPTRNPLSSPALSLDRLRIDYGRGRSIMISPERQDEFVRDIETRRGTRS